MGTENENLLGEIIKCACVLPDSSSPGDNPMNSQNMFQHDSEDKYCILNRRGKQDMAVAITKTSSLKNGYKNLYTTVSFREKKIKNKRKLEADLEQASIQPSVKYNLKISITNKTLMSFNLSLSSLLCLQALRMVSKPSYG